MEIASVLAQGVYARDRSAVEPEAGTPALADMAAEFEQRLRNGEATARAALLGRADPHALVEALASTQSAVETVAAVRDRVVEAYQEILRMPV